MRHFKITTPDKTEFIISARDIVGDIATIICTVSKRPIKGELWNSVAACSNEYSDFYLIEHAKLMFKDASVELVVAQSEDKYAGSCNAALFGVSVWNPLEVGIQGVPLMVPVDEYNRVASNLADALSLALQYVPLESEDAEKIRKLERAATILPNKMCHD